VAGWSGWALIGPPGPACLQGRSWRHSVVVGHTGGCRRQAIGVIDVGRVGVAAVGGSRRPFPDNVTHHHTSGPVCRYISSAGLSGASQIKRSIRPFRSAGLLGGAQQRSRSNGSPRPPGGIPYYWLLCCCAWWNGTVTSSIPQQISASHSRFFGPLAKRFALAHPSQSWSQ
jgi:hypothetical protein